MKRSVRKKICRKCLLVLLSTSMLAITTLSECIGQELPPRPPTTPPGIPEPPPRPMTVTVNLLQNLNFGAFCHYNAGGTVIMFPNGSRSSTGDVVLLNMGYSFSAGLIDVVGYPGTPVSLLNGPDATLGGSNGGSLTLRITNSDMDHPFIITTMPPSPSVLSIGGTLFVGSAVDNPPGNYSGTINLTFVQE